jgi:Flp pilus assembly protein TadG
MRLTGTDGATAAEFALVLPLLLLFLFGIIDVGRYMWSINQVEKATQAGVRVAVVTDMVPTGLANMNFGQSLGQGASIPSSSFASATCSKPSGTVTCTWAGGANAPAFDRVLARIRDIAPSVEASDVTIAYANSGLGYAGDPNGPDVAPLVTVSAATVNFQPVTSVLFGASMTLPVISATLTLEDGAGSTFN